MIETISILFFLCSVLVVGFISFLIGRCVGEIQAERRDQARRRKLMEDYLQDL